MEIERDPQGAQLVNVSETVTAIIEDNGFFINNSKVRLRGRGQRLEVTGLTVNEFPNVPRWWVRRLRAMLHSWKELGLEGAEKRFRESYQFKHARPEATPAGFRAVVLGSLRYLKMVKGRSDRVYINLHNRAADLLPDSFERITEVSDWERIAEALWVVEVDSANGGAQGTAFFLEGYGLVTCAHVVEGAQRILVFQPGRPESKTVASVGRVSAKYDLAILSVNATPKGVLLVTSGPPPAAESSVTFIGYPEYAEGHSHHVVNSAVTGTQVFDGVLHVYVDKAIIAGNSGAPLLNEDVRVVGVVRRGVAAFEEQDVRPSSAVAIRHLAELPPA